jgi:hypothetical protein
MSKSDAVRFSAEDFANINTKYMGVGTLVYTSKAILESVSSISLNQSDTDGFLTFSVTFKYMNHIHNIDFGDDAGVSKTPASS